MKNRSLFRALFFVGFLSFFCACSTRANDSTEPDTQPVPIKTPPPVYPIELRRQRISGLVDLVISLDEQGNVINCTVSKSTRPEFIRPTVKAVKQWKFKPAMKDGVPVKYQLLFPINFTTG